MSVKVEGIYKGALHCVATHGPSGASIETDAPVDNRGKGEAFSPTDLIGTSMATCMTTIMGIRAEDHGWDLSGLTFEVIKEMAVAGPRRVARIAVTFTMPAGLPDEAQTVLEEAAYTCPVHRSLHPDIEKPIFFNWS